MSGITGALSRPNSIGAESFYGPTENSETSVGSIAVEMRQLAEKDLTEIGADASAFVLPDSGVLEQDFLTVAGVRYRISEVNPANFFGTTTHLELHLVRERRDG